MTNLTLAEMAAAFTRTEGGGNADEALFLRRLRHLDALNLIRAMPEPRDARGTAQFEQREMLIARLLIAAIDAGITKGDLEWLRTVIELQRRVVIPSSGNYEISLDANLPRIRAGEIWALEVLGGRDMESDDRAISPHWIKFTDDGRRLSYSDVLYPHPLTTQLEFGDGRPVSTVLYINATALLRPYLDGDA